MRILLLALILSWPFFLCAQQTEDRATIPIERMLSADPNLPSESYGFKIGDTVYFLNSIYFDDPIITDRRNLADIESPLRQLSSRVRVVAPADGLSRLGTRYTVEADKSCSLEQKAQWEFPYKPSVFLQVASLLLWQPL